jgi:uncharacterized repeat protein (TIGR03806 family)
MKGIGTLALIFAMAGSQVIGACGSSPASPTGVGGAGSGGASAGSGGRGSTGSGGAGGSGGNAVAQTCVPFADKDQPIQKLSQTGCVRSNDPKALAVSVIPYEVNSPLWSDGADKSRGLALPAGGKIHVKNCTANPAECPGSRDVADDGKWVLPIGTVMVKSFLFDGKFLETRLLMRFGASTWVGYSYAWDEAQTDATLVGAERDETMFATGQRTVSWHFPSREDCMQCHTPEASFALGTETAQMNRVVGGVNQIDKLAALGAFDTPVATPYKAALVTPTVSQAGGPPASATIEQRATSYLHANCSFCHRPADDIDCASDPCQDLRFGLSLAVRNLCNTIPSKSDLGVLNAKNLAPGQPEQSLLWVRMTRPPDDGDGKHGRMPLIASYVVDQPAVDLIGQWITSIKSCP